MKSITIFHLKIIIFTAMNNRKKINGRFFLIGNTNAPVICKHFLYTYGVGLGVGAKVQGNEF